MNVVALNGSPRKDGNTMMLMTTVLDELQAAGIATEMIQIGGNAIRGCAACRSCFANKNNRCVMTDDLVNDCIEKLRAADGIILGSPVYFSDITSEMKALIDRAGLVGRANGDLYKRKLGAAVIAVRRAGAIHAFDTLNHFFLINQMIIPGSSYWNIGIGREKGDVQNDAEGMQTMKTLGQNMAWLLKQLHP